jgi:hypothetical protein
MQMHIAGSLKASRHAWHFVLGLQIQIHGRLWRQETGLRGVRVRMRALTFDWPLHANCQWMARQSLLLHDALLSMAMTLPETLLLLH